MRFYFLKKISIFLWLSIVAVSCYFILNDANWILGDDKFFLRHISSGNLIDFIVIPTAGRFYPLTYQEFNILLLCSLNDPFWYYCVSCIYFIVTALFFTLSLKELSNIYIYSKEITCALCVFFLCCLIVSKSVSYVFLDIIFAERNVLCHLSVFLYCYLRSIRKESLLFSLIASFFAVTSFYYKEPVFGIFVVFCLCPFVFDYKNVSKQHKVFSCIIFINVLVYCLLYYFFVYQFLVKGYNEGRVSESYSDNFLFLLKNNYFFILMLLFGCFRFIRIVFFLEKKYLIADSLLFSGIAYFFAFVILKLNSFYYFTPIYVLVLPAFYVFAISLRHNFLILFFIILLAGTSYFKSDLKEVINDVHSARINDMEQVNYLCDKIDNGYEIFYFQVENIRPENIFNNVLMDYFRRTVVAFLSYNLGYEYQLKTVDELFPLGDKQILISSGLVTSEKNFDFSELGFVSSSSMYRKNLTVYEKQEPCFLSLPYKTDLLETDLLYMGLYGKEPNGRWGSDVVKLFFKVENKEDLYLKFELIPFVTENFPDNTGKIYINDAKVGEWKFTAMQRDNLDFTVPANLIKDDGSVMIELVSDNVTSPKELGLSSDTRKLGLFFYNMQIGGA